MLRRIAIVALVLVAVSANVATASGAGFREGVAAGNATASSVRLWTRAPRPGTVELVLSRRRDLAGAPLRPGIEARAVDGNVAAATVSGLAPGRSYWYRFEQGRARSPVGRFRTAPARGRDAAVRFGVVAGLLDPRARPRLGLLDRVTRRPNDFNVLLGDAVSTAGAASLAAARARYSRLLAAPAVERLRARAGLYATWAEGEAAAGRRRGLRAFTEALPVEASPRTGLYRSVRWGRAVELFLLDERSFRGTDASSSCINPLVRFPDPAPAVPQSLREPWGGFVYPLLAEVGAGCLARLGSPRRTILGHRQLATLRREIARSTARFKVLLTEEPLSQLYFDPYGRFEGYEAERAKLVSFLQDNVDGLVVISAGGAGGVVAPVRTQTLEPPNPNVAGYLDVGVGPVAGPTFEARIRARLAEGDQYREVSRLFFKRQPPQGAGVICAASHRRNVAQVEIRGRRMTIRLIGADGAVIRDRDGTPCGPYRIVEGAQRS